LHCCTLLHYCTLLHTIALNRCKLAAATEEWRAKQNRSADRRKRREGAKANRAREAAKQAAADAVAAAAAAAAGAADAKDDVKAPMPVPVADDVKAMRSRSAMVLQHYDPTAVPILERFEEYLDIAEYTMRVNKMLWFITKGEAASIKEFYDIITGDMNMQKWHVRTCICIWPI